MIRDVLNRRKLTGICLKNLGGEIDDFVILKKLFRFKKLEEPKTDAMQVGSRTVSLLMVHHPRARRYLLRLRPDGTARVTIPRNGSIRAARDFASRNVGWLEQQFQRLAARPKIPDTWNLGTEILFRGELVRIEPDADGSICFSTERMNVSDAHADLRPAIQKHLRASCIQGTAAPRHGIGGTAWSECVTRHREESKISLGFVFAARNDLAQLAIDSVARFCARLHHPARIGASAANEPLGKILAGGGAPVS